MFWDWKIQRKKLNQFLIHCIDDSIELEIVNSSFRGRWCLAFLYCYAFFCYAGRWMLFLIVNWSASSSLIAKIFSWIFLMIFSKVVHWDLTLHGSWSFKTLNAMFKSLENEAWTFLKISSYAFKDAEGSVFSAGSVALSKESTLNPIPPWLFLEPVTPWEGSIWPPLLISKLQKLLTWNFNQS